MGSFLKEYLNQVQSIYLGEKIIDMINARQPRKHFQMMSNGYFKGPSINTVSKTLNLPLKFWIDVKKIAIISFSTQKIEKTHTFTH